MKLQKKKKSFTSTPLTSFKRTKNIRDLVDGNTIVNDKVQKQQTIKKQGDASRVIVRKLVFAANK